MQFPAGWLADKYDRRWVLIGTSLASIVVCAVTALLQTPTEITVFAMGFLFGVFTMPVYSISAAHANDFADPDFVVELSAALMFLYGMGAIASPLLASVLIQNFGPGAMFAMISAAHLGLVGFGLFRMTVRENKRSAYSLHIYSPNDLHSGASLATQGSQLRVS